MAGSDRSLCPLVQLGANTDGRGGAGDGSVMQSRGNITAPVSRESVLTADAVAGPVMGAEPVWRRGLGAQGLRIAGTWPEGRRRRLAETKRPEGPDQALSPAARASICEHIRTIEQLNLLIWLQQRASDEHELDGVAEALGIGPSMAQAAFAQLSRREAVIVTAGNPVRVRNAPQSSRSEKLAAQLAQLYESRPRELAVLAASRPSESTLTGRRYAFHKHPSPSARVRSEA